MKLGILGTGMIVREFLPWLAGPDCPFTVQALCSTQRSAPVADEMCEQYGIPQRTTNYFELLQWVDVIYLAVPNLQHYRYAKVALEAVRAPLLSWLSNMKFTPARLQIGSGYCRSWLPMSSVQRWLPQFETVRAARSFWVFL